MYSRSGDLFCLGCLMKDHQVVLQAFPMTVNVVDIDGCSADLRLVLWDLGFAVSSVVDEWSS